MWAVRIIKKEGCAICKSFIERLSLDKTFTFDVMDADAPDLQKQMDEWKIDEVPVVQIYDTDGKLPPFHFPPGTFSKSTILAKRDLLTKKK